MKVRTRTLGVVAASAVAGLLLGVAVASGGSAASSPDDTTTSTVSMPMTDMSTMGSMMPGDGSGMADMMGSIDMSTMHSMMHDMMRGSVSDEALAACDEAHDQMVGQDGAGASEPSNTDTTLDPSQHAAHHGGSDS
jgi:hypothetical protein